MARPARDFEGMFEQFATSSLSRVEFLRLKGINPQSGSAYRGTHDWDARRLKRVLGAAESENYLKPTAKEEVYQIAAKLGEPTPTDITASLAAQLAWHVQDLLDSAAGNRTLNLQDLVRLTEVLSQLQTIQRRSVYRDHKTNNTHDQGAGNASPIIEEIPVYSVDMTDQGKFRSQRPRKLEGKELKDFLDNIDDGIVEQMPSHDEIITPIRYAVYTWDSDQKKNVRLY